MRRVVLLSLLVPGLLFAGMAIGAAATAHAADVSVQHVEVSLDYETKATLRKIADGVNERCR